MRISEWSSDVCSSDLNAGRPASSTATMRPGDARCRGRGPASAEYSGQKKRGPKAPPVLQCRERSEALDVTHVRRTAVGVVQVEVERTAVVDDQFRQLVGNVVDRSEEHTAEIQAIM